MLGLFFPGQGKTNESHEFLRDLEDTFSSCDSSNLRDVCRIAEFEMFLWTKCIQYDNTEQFENEDTSMIYIWNNWIWDTSVKKQLF